MMMTPTGKLNNNKANINNIIILNHHFLVTVEEDHNQYLQKIHPLHPWYLLLLEDINPSQTQGQEHNLGKILQDPALPPVAMRRASGK
jgi:hypothetical protein